MKETHGEREGEREREREREREKASVKAAVFGSFLAYAYSFHTNIFEKLVLFVLFQICPYFFLTSVTQVSRLLGQ